MMASARMILVVLLCFLLKIIFLQSFSIKSDNSQNISCIRWKKHPKCVFWQITCLFGQVHENTHHDIIFYWRCRVNLKFNSRWFVGINKHRSRICQNNHFMTTVDKFTQDCLHIYPKVVICGMYQHLSTAPRLQLQLNHSSRKTEIHFIDILVGTMLLFKLPIPLPLLMIMSKEKSIQS